MDNTQSATHFGKEHATLVCENQVIAIEDLNVRGIMVNRKLARAIGTGVCSECGTVSEGLPLNIREWACSDCGTKQDRDIAAAKVILQKALHTVRSTEIKACGLAHKPEPCLI
ncbi:zinc ribbon domain-containing protein [Candidatus Nitrosacidococcus tergens]|uniref:Transposase n=1 Tax=Candidatus Nitrosacidococcus tergens TaxID=553981 RepID=A0A7G1QAU4_9GAMM